REGAVPILASRAGVPPAGPAASRRHKKEPIMPEQTYANHKRYLPLYHFIVVPLFALNLIARIVYAVRNPTSKLAWWAVVVAVSLLLFVGAARLMALTVQNRLIRLEERLRLERV